MSESAEGGRSGPRVEPAWEALLERVAPPKAPARPPVALHVLGGSDAGKTTFCRWLGRALARRGLKVAAVDCDPGQGRIGPPATVGLAWSPPDGDAPSALRFVGAVSPAGHFLQLTVGIGALDRLARGQGAGAVVFDVSGFMDTDAGREYHTLLVEATVAGRRAPRGPAAGHLVALQRDRELEPVLRAFDLRGDVEVHRLAVSSAVEPRNREERRRSREARFRHHFADAEPVRVPLRRLGLQGRVPALRPSHALRGLLVAPLDEAGFALGPHLLDEIEGRGGEGVLRLSGPRLDLARVASIHFGSLRLEANGAPLE